MTNCTMSGTAFLGPIYTGAKTGSVYQSSLSLGSGKAINHLKSKEIKKLGFKNSMPILKDVPYVDKDPYIILAYKVDKIEYSHVIEPEPLP